MRYAAVIFDFDGTLADTSQGVLASLRYALDKLGESDPGEETLKRFIGPTLYDSFRTRLGFDDERTDEAIRLYREFYRPEGVYMFRPYDGIVELLHKLRGEGATLSVASSKPQEQLEVVVRRMGVTDLFERIVGSDPNDISSDKIRLVRRAKTKPDSVMVGDAAYDIRAAHDAGIASVAAAYGFTPAEELFAEKPDYVARSVAELSDILLK